MPIINLKTSSLFLACWTIMNGVWFHQAMFWNTLKWSHYFRLFFLIIWEVLSCSAQRGLRTLSRNTQPIRWVVQCQGLRIWVLLMSCSAANYPGLPSSAWRPSGLSLEMLKGLYGAEEWTGLISCKASCPLYHLSAPIRELILWIILIFKCQILDCGLITWGYHVLLREAKLSLNHSENKQNRIRVEGMRYPIQISHLPPPPNST